MGFVWFWLVAVMLVAYGVVAILVPRALPTVM